MSPDVIVKAADLLAACEETVSIRAVCRVLQATTGKAARWAQVQAILKAREIGEFTHPATVGQHIDEERATPRPQVANFCTIGQQAGNTFEHDGQQHTPALMVPLFSPPHPPISPPLNPSQDLEESSKLRLLNSSQSRVDEQPRGNEDENKKRRSLKLPFDRDLLEARNAILKAVWSELQPLIGRSTTFTDWRKRNANIARSFAAGNFKPEKIVAAWRQVSRDRGEPVRELFIVQKHIEHLQVVVHMHDGFRV